MCVYNSVDGYLAAPTQTFFKSACGTMGFQGYVVSDCGQWATSIGIINTPPLGRSGCGSSQSRYGPHLRHRYRTLVDEVKAATLRKLRSIARWRGSSWARFRLGMFDPPERVPFSKIPISENDFQRPQQLARDAERETIVLLKTRVDFSRWASRCGKLR